jgi:hypothetical protein
MCFYGIAVLSGVEVTRRQKRPNETWTISLDRVETDPDRNIRAISSNQKPWVNSISRVISQNLEGAAPKAVYFVSTN